MNDSHDNEFRLFNSKVDSKGKARHWRSPGVAVAVNNGIAQRMLDETLECSECFVEELVSETCALLFVPRGSCRQMSIRLFRESEGSRHSFFLISAITSSAGRPGLPSAS